MKPSLNDIQVGQFRTNGFFAPVRVLSTKDAKSFRQRLEQFIASNGKGATLRTKPHLNCPALMELVRLPAILDAVCSVLGPDVLCRSSSVFLKEPRDSAYVAWHQDAKYWDLSPPDVVTAWVALSDSTLSNGAMQVLPGSHLGGLLPHQEKSDSANLLSRGQVIADSVDFSGAVPLLLDAGEISLHHVLIAHSSPPNKSDQRRIGYAIRYVATHVRKTGLRRDGALLVRGEDRFGHFDPEPSELLASVAA